MPDAKSIVGALIVIVIAAIAAQYSRQALWMVLVVLLSVYFLTVWRDWFGLTYWRVGSTLLVAITTGALCGGAWWFIVKPTSRPASTGAGTISVVVQPKSTTPSDIVVELDLTPNKTLTIKNVGPQDVSDWGVVLTRYEFDPNAFTRGELKLLPNRANASSMLVGGTQLKARSDSKPIGLGNIVPMFFEQPKGVREIGGPEMTTYTSVRVTFRDPRTGQLYAIYRVTSSAKGPSFLPDDMDPRYVAGGGPDELTRLLRGVRPIIVEHQEQFFNDGADTYVAN